MRSSTRFSSSLKPQNILPQSLKDARPEVPWRKIHALGNLLRHEYRHVDSDVLWSIVTGQLAELDRAAAALLENLDEAGRKDV